MRQTAVLEVEGLSKAFGKKVVLTAASFVAHRGQVTCLMGRNGAGKTTILDVAVGRVRPDDGRVLLNGAHQRRPTLSSMAGSGVYYSAQGSALTDLFTIQQHLGAVADVFGREQDLVSVVERLNLEDCLARKPRSLSGGERQRAALAMAVLRSPICLLIDEPFVGVTPLDRALISEGLGTLRGQGCAVVVSGHEVEDLFSISDEIIWLVGGTTRFLGAPEMAREDPEFAHEYLGPNAWRPASQDQL